MTFLTEALRGAARVPWAIVLYAGVAIPLGLLSLGWAHLVAIEYFGDWPTLTRSMTRLGIDLILVLASAAVKTIAFSLIGRELAKPLWKVALPWDALRRFFVMWMILDLAVLTTLRIVEQLAADESPAVGLVLLVHLVLFLSSTIVGGAIMYHGRFATDELGQALAPLGREIGKTLMLVLAGVAQFLWIVLSGLDPSDLAWLWQAPVVFLGSVLIDCVIFSGAWIICMTPPPEEEDDLDL